MGVYIKGVEMPKEYGRCMVIFPDSRVTTEFGSIVIATVVSVPPHGRLIDAEKIYDAVEQRYRMSSGIEHRCQRDLLDLICAAPTIIPAEEQELWEGRK